MLVLMSNEDAPGGKKNQLLDYYWNQNWIRTQNVKVVRRSLYHVTLTHQRICYFEVLAERIPIEIEAL